LTEAERADLKDRGRKLLVLLLDHLNEEPRRSSLKLVEAEDQATQYGRRAAALGASLAATLEAFVRFRGAFIAELAAIARRRRLDVREATALLVEGESAVDRLLVALTDSYTAERP
jgi:urease accessory protein UreF